MKSPSLMRNVSLAVGASRCVVTQLPADGAERRQLKLGGALMFVIVTGSG